MILILSSVLLVLIFTSISLLHFYWALSGRWSIDRVVPTNAEGKPMLQTGVVASLVVGFGLLAFAMYYVLSGIIDFMLPGFISTATGWIIPLIFFLRAIGDFKYAGFFKKVKGTTFARVDTRYFTPLCLLIAFLGLLAQLFK